MEFYVILSDVKMRVKCVVQGKTATTQSLVASPLAQLVHLLSLFESQETSCNTNVHLYMISFGNSIYKFRHSMIISSRDGGSFIWIRQDSMKVQQISSTLTHTMID